MDRRFEQAHRMNRAELQVKSMLHERKPFRNHAHRSLRIIEMNLLADFRAERDAKEVDERARQLEELSQIGPVHLGYNTHSKSEA